MPLVLALALAFGIAAPSAAPTTLTGFSVVDLDGRTWIAERLEGRVVLVVFWASWCGPCLREVPVIREAHRRFSSAGLEVVAISLDADRRHVISWVNRHRPEWTQVHEAGGVNGPAAKRFGVGAIPALFLYDRSGDLVATGLRGERLLRRLEALVRPR